MGKEDFNGVVPNEKSQQISKEIKLKIKKAQKKKVLFFDNFVRKELKRK